MRKLFILGLLLIPTNSYSQIVMNPNFVEFESIDHSTIAESGQPVISSYILEVFLYNPTIGLMPQLQSTPFPKELGVVIAGTPLRYKYSLAVIGLFIPPGPLYVAKVRATGSFGDSWSGFSNQFSSDIPLPPPPALVNPPDPASGFVIIR